MSATQRYIAGRMLTGAALKEVEPLNDLNDYFLDSQFSDQQFGIQEKKHRLITKFRLGLASFLIFCGFLLPLVLKDRISVIVAFFLLYWFLSQLASRSTAARGVRATN